MTKRSRKGQTPLASFLNRGKVGEWGRLTPKRSTLSPGCGNHEKKDFLKRGGEKLYAIEANKGKKEGVWARQVNQLELKKQKRSCSLPGIVSRPRTEKKTK